MPTLGDAQVWMLGVDASDLWLRSENNHSEGTKLCLKIYNFMCLHKMGPHAANLFNEHIFTKMNLIDEVRHQI